MSKKKIYCEVEFFKQFVNMRPETNIPTKGNIRNVKLWSDMFLFLDSVNINFDDPQEFAKLAHKNEYFKMLWKTSIHQKDKIDFLQDKYPKLNNFSENKEDNDVMTSIFFSAEDKDMCKSVQSQYGVLVVSVDNIFNTSHYFQTNIEAVSTAEWECFEWSFLNKWRHPNNSLCMIDGYIFNSKDSVKLNLIPILNNLLPNKLSIPYHISIFSRDNVDDNSLRVFNEAIEIISSELKTLKPDLEVEISVHRTIPGNFHDRYIVTNNMIIESGSGFDLLKYKSDYDNSVRTINKTTISSSYVYFQVNKSSKQGKYNKDLEAFLLNASRYLFNKRDKESNSKNRLLEQ